MLHLLSKDEFNSTLKSFEEQTESVSWIIDLRLHSKYAVSHIKNAINVSLPTALLRRPSFDIGKVFACIKCNVKVSLDEINAIFLYDSSMAGMNRIYDLVQKFRRGGYSKKIYLLSNGFEAFASSHPDAIVSTEMVKESVPYKIDINENRKLDILHLSDPSAVSTPISPDYSFPLRVPINIPPPLCTPSVVSDTFSEFASHAEYPGFSGLTPFSIHSPTASSVRSCQSIYGSPLSPPNSAFQAEMPYFPISPAISCASSCPSTPDEQKNFFIVGNAPQQTPARPSLRSVPSYPSSNNQRRPPASRVRSFSNYVKSSNVVNPSLSQASLEIIPRKSMKRDSNAQNDGTSTMTSKLKPSAGLSNTRDAPKPGGLRRANKPCFNKETKGSIFSKENKGPFTCNPWGAKKVSPPPCEVLADLNTASIFYKFKRLEEMEMTRSLAFNDSKSDWCCLASSRSTSISRKNRYTDIVPYDKTRVRLAVPKGCSDYINASHIDVGNKKYIACQAPKPGTLLDFWEMVWHNSGTNGVIVMLTNLYEAGSEKCSQYWPDNKDHALCLEGGLRISVQKYETFEDLKVNTHLFRLDKPNSPPKYIHHFWVHTWFDKTHPDIESITGIIRCIDKVPNDGPMFVHCSAGVGRTGTFIAVDQILQVPKNVLPKTTNLEDSKDFIFNCVNSLRSQRMKMVQNFEQFKFLYDVVDYLNSGVNQASKPLMT